MDSNKVIVALEPIEARCLAGEYIETMLEGEPVDFIEVENRAQAKLRAALDTDPEELVEAVGLAMEDWACRMHGILASSHRPGKSDDGREARKVLDAALSALTGKEKNDG